MVFLILQHFMPFYKILVILRSFFFATFALLTRRRINMKPVNEEVAYENYKTFIALNNKLRESLAKALDADETRINKKGVIILYRKVVKDINNALSIRISSVPSGKRREVEDYRLKIEKFLRDTQERLRALENSEESRVEIRCNTPSTSVNPRTQKSAPLDKSRLLKDVNEKFGAEIISTILTRTETRLSDIQGNYAAKLALEENIILPAANPKLFTGLRAPSKGILLFGPPGNGKTMIAKAVANECGSTFFNISAASIMSKWVGDGEKLVQALFQVARNAQPAIIFIDEVDSMLCERSDNENGAARRVKTEFLVQLDGSDSKNSDRILVLGATNRPWELDEGILRRFPQRIFIDLPDSAARADFVLKSFKEHGTPTELSSREFDRLASLTENYSYSDLLSLCRAAALHPIRDLPRDRFQRTTPNQLRPVCFGDLEMALRTVRPSSNLENRRKLVEFAENYAQMS